MSLSADPCGAALRSCVAGSVFGFARFTRVFAALQCMPTHAQPHQKTHCSPSSATPGIFGLFSWCFGGSSLPPCPPRRSLFCFCGSLVVVFDSNASPIPPKDAPPATPSAPALLGLFSWYFGDNLLLENVQCSSLKFPKCRVASRHSCTANLPAGLLDPVLHSNDFVAYLSPRQAPLLMPRRPPDPSATPAHYWTLSFGAWFSHLIRAQGKLNLPCPSDPPGALYWTQSF